MSRQNGLKIGYGDPQACFPKNPTTLVPTLEFSISPRSSQRLGQTTPHFRLFDQILALEWWALFSSAYSGCMITAEKDPRPRFDTRPKEKLGTAACSMMFINSFNKHKILVFGRLDSSVIGP